MSESRRSSRACGSQPWKKLHASQIRQPTMKRTHARKAQAIAPPRGPDPSSKGSVCDPGHQAPTVSAGVALSGSEGEGASQRSGRSCHRRTFPSVALSIAIATSALTEISRFNSFEMCWLRVPRSPRQLSLRAYGFDGLGDQGMLFGDDHSTRITLNRVTRNRVATAYNKAGKIAG